MATLASVSSYVEQGFHVEAGVFSPLECDVLIGAAWGYDGRNHFSPFMQPHRADPHFLAALRTPRIVALAEEFCGGKVSGLQTTWYYGPPDGPGWMRHQDNTLVQAPAGAFVAAWCAMRDVTEGVGGIVVYPGTQRLPLLPTAKVEYRRSADPNADYECDMPGGYKGFPIQMPRGSVLFMHGQLVHESGTNRTSRFRHALLLTYIRQGAPFRPGDTAKREEVNVY